MPSIDCSRYPEVARQVDTRIYTRRAIAEAQAAFREHCRVETRPVDANHAVVAVKPNSIGEAEVRRVILEFWNYALDAACQRKLESGDDG